MFPLPLVITGEKQYLWLPVQRDVEKTRLRLFADVEDAPELLLEFHIQAGAEEPDFYAPVELSAYSGRAFLLDIDAPESWFDRLRIVDAPPPREPCRRPELHFSADRGWINDPNGLIFDQGLYHLYFQYNPYGVEWGDMHWGHAVSADLIHWKQLDTALYPDKTGTMFSGSAVRDGQNRLGYGGDSLLFYYTAAGNYGDWSKDVPFTQQIAVLPAGEPADGLLRKTGIRAVEHIAGENRDPKVFWHEESGAYGMVLYLENNDFALLRSTDLRHWDMTQRLTLEGAWECPDLLYLPVEGSAEKKWVFWSADGYYFIGVYDGYRFTRESGRLSAYQTKLPYAAQTYSGLADRTVSIAWLRTSNGGRPYTGLMAVPAELSLVRTEEGPRLRLPYVWELLEARRVTAERTGFPAGKTSFAQTGDNAFEVRLVLPADSGRSCLACGGMDFTVDMAAGTIAVGESVMRLPKMENANGPLWVSVLMDNDVVELRAARDTVYGVWEHGAPSLAGEVVLDLEQAQSGLRAEIARFE